MGFGSSVYISIDIFDLKNKRLSFVEFENLYQKLRGESISIFDAVYIEDEKSCMFYTFMDKIVKEYPEAECFSDSSTFVFECYHYGCPSRIISVFGYLSFFLPKLRFDFEMGLYVSEISFIVRSCVLKRWEKYCTWDGPIEDEDKVEDEGYDTKEFVDQVLSPARYKMLSLSNKL